MAGCRVLTRAVEDLGKAGYGPANLGDRRVPAAASAAADPAGSTTRRRHARRGSVRSSTRPLLSETEISARRMAIRPLLMAVALSVLSCSGASAPGAAGGELRDQPAQQAGPACSSEPLCRSPRPATWKFARPVMQVRRSGRPGRTGLPGNCRGRRHDLPRRGGKDLLGDLPQPGPGGRWKTILDVMVPAACRRSRIIWWREVEDAPPARPCRGDEDCRRSSSAPFEAERGPPWSTSSTASRAVMK